MAVRVLLPRYVRTLLTQGPGLRPDPSSIYASSFIGPASDLSFCLSFTH